MIKDLEKVFLPEYEVYLENILYEKFDVQSKDEAHTLFGEDKITAIVNDNESVAITVTRKLNFEPEKIFSLKISFGALLKIDPKKSTLYDWKAINMEEEFRENGDFITDDLMARISLLIAQITSAAGRLPLVLPPNVIKEN